MSDNCSCGDDRTFAEAYGKVVYPTFDLYASEFYCAEVEELLVRTEVKYRRLPESTTLIAPCLCIGADARHVARYGRADCGAW